MYKCFLYLRTYIYFIAGKGQIASVQKKENIKSLQNVRRFVHFATHKR